MDLKQMAKSFGIGVLGALITWILSGSSASIGIGIILFYLEATRKNDDAENKGFSAQKKKSFWHS